MRYRKIVKYGDSILIRLKSQDLIDLDLHIGDNVNIDDIIKKPMEQIK